MGYTVGMIGSGEVGVEDVDSIMEEILAESDVLLFEVACAGKNSLGGEYAAKRGAPTKFVSSADSLMKESDYILAVVGEGGDEGAVKRFMMRAKMAEKHGKMVCLG